MESPPLSALIPVWSDPVHQQRCSAHARMRSSAMQVCMPRRHARHTRRRGRPSHSPPWTPVTLAALDARHTRRRGRPSHSPPWTPVTLAALDARHTRRPGRPSHSSPWTPVTLAALVTRHARRPGRPSHSPPWMRHAHTRPPALLADRNAPSPHPPTRVLPSTPPPTECS
eukprot:358684-Chlamydomonas_euryale.AAC.5